MIDSAATVLTVIQISRTFDIDQSVAMASPSGFRDRRLPARVLIQCIIMSFSENDFSAQSATPLKDCNPLVAAIAILSVGIPLMTASRPTTTRRG